ncbi:hypothetical protein D3C72_1563450 [compost metagenome]
MPDFLDGSQKPEAQILGRDVLKELVQGSLIFRANRPHAELEATMGGQMGAPIGHGVRTPSIAGRSFVPGNIFEPAG